MRKLSKSEKEEAKKEIDNFLKENNVSHEEAEDYFLKILLAS